MWWPRLTLFLSRLAHGCVCCPSGHVRAAGAELCARLCLPQAQRWRSENFERPVDLEGSGDDDSFPDDELDDLYSGSGSGCKYPPLPLALCLGSAVCLRCPTQGSGITGNRGLCRLVSMVGVRGRGGGWGGQAGEASGPQARGRAARPPGAVARALRP